MTLAQLLIVQEHDSAIDRLVYSRANLPEFAALAMIDDEQVHVEAERAAVAEQRHGVSRDQQRLEDDAALVTDRIDKENERLYSGTVTAHKDLQAIQDELSTLNARRSDIEDHVLEVMEAGEPLDTELAVFDQKLEALEARRSAATDSMTASQAQIDMDLESETKLRAEAAVPVSDELLALYETSRADCGGLGVSRLVDKTCEGCHLQLAAVELDRIRKEPDDTVIRCGECTRILVR